MMNNLSMDSKLSLILFLVAWIFAFIGAIIQWQFNVGDDDDYNAFLVVFFTILKLIVAELHPAFKEFQLICIGLLLYLSSYFTATASTFGSINNSVGHKLTASAAMLTISTWIAFIGLLPISHVTDALKKINAKHMGTLIGLVAAIVTLLGVVLGWAFDGRIRHAAPPLASAFEQFLLWNQISLVNLFIFLAVLLNKFAGLKLVFDRELKGMFYLVNAIIIIISLDTAIQLQVSGLPRKYSNIGVAGMSLIWIGQILQILAVTIIPAAMSSMSSTSSSSSSSSSSHSNNHSGPAVPDLEKK